MKLRRCQTLATKSALKALLRFTSWGFNRINNCRREKVLPFPAFFYALRYYFVGLLATKSALKALSKYNWRNENEKDFARNRFYGQQRR